MDFRTIRLLLSASAACLLTTTPALAASTSDEEPGYLDEQPAVAPEIVRLGLHESDLDDENFEVGLYTGFISVEHFGAHSVVGVRGAWHVTEDLFFEAHYNTTEVDSTPAEDLNALTLGSRDRTFNQYDLSIGLNLLPGEVFVGEKWVFNTDLYVLVGGGSLEFLGEEEFAVNFGAGVRLIVNDWLALHFTVQDIITDQPNVLNPDGNNGSAHHLHYGTSASIFF